MQDIVIIVPREMEKVMEVLFRMIFEKHTITEA